MDIFVKIIDTDNDKKVAFFYNDKIIDNDVFQINKKQVNFTFDNISTECEPILLKSVYNNRIIFRQNYNSFTTTWNVYDFLGEFKVTTARWGYKYINDTIFKVVPEPLKNVLFPLKPPQELIKVKRRKLDN